MLGLVGVRGPAPSVVNSKDGRGPAVVMAGGLNGAFAAELVVRWADRQMSLIGHRDLWRHGLLTVIGVLIAGACTRAPSLNLVGVWEDESPKTGGQMPGGTLWEFRSDGTYSALAGLMLATRPDEAGAAPSDKTKTDGCSWFAKRITSDGESHARMLIGMNDQGGSYSVEDGIVTLESPSAKYAGDFRVTGEPGKLTLSGVGRSTEHRLVRVDWYKLPPLSVIRQCSSNQPRPVSAAPQGAAADNAAR